LKDIKGKTIKGIAWTFLDRAGSQFIGFVVTLMLARILSPDEFGLIAMASVVIAITRIFIDSGLNDSLIQKQNCTTTDFSTVFFFNMVVTVVLFCVIFISAPAIARFFGYPELVPVIRVLGLKPCIAAFSFVQMAIIQKNMKFRLVPKLRLPAFIISGVIGLVMAWKGYGVWALVAQSLAETFLFTLLLWIVADWWPTLVFDKTIFRFHWKHGSRLLVVNVLNAIYRNIFSLIIGKFFSAAQLGFYSRAESFKAIILNNTTGLVQTVSYPALAQMQDDNERLKKAYRKILQATLFVILPVSAVFITAAGPIIEFLLTPKWLPAAPILVVLMLSLVFSPFNTINLNILKVKRRTDLLLRTDVINKIFLVAIVTVTVNLGFDYLVMTNLIIAVFALFIINYFTNKLISYSIREQLTDFWPLLAAFVVATGLTYYASVWFTSEYALMNIIVRGACVVVFYTCTILVLRRRYIFDLITEIRLFRTGGKTSLV
jgi:teichuronic acid exporter